jgi:hypothetical protein
MLFMVIEHYQGDSLAAVEERFGRSGRMLPDGVIYHASWFEPSGARCFQIMEAPARDALDRWIARWEDLVAFEVLPVVTSAEFWQRRT